MAAYDVAIRLAPGKESLLTARAESKAALLERSMADMHSSACSASAAALPEKLHRPPSSTCVPKGSCAQVAPPLSFVARLILCLSPHVVEACMTRPA